MDTAEWPQEIVVKPMEEILVIPNNACPTKPDNNSIERKVRPQKDQQAPNCPRCNSTNTKFCYYNNYSLSQPRYFCKACRRYWTAGGSLRNIPVGGGSRKNKRSSTTTSSSSKKIVHDNNDLVITPHIDLSHHQPHSQNPNMKFQESQDLNLGFPSAQDFKTISDLIQVPNFDDLNKIENLPSSTNSSQLSALELLTGITTTTATTRGFSSFFPMHQPIGDPRLFSLADQLKPSLNFTLDGLGGSGFGNLQSSMQESNGRLLFPFEDLNMKQSQGPSNTSTTTGNVEQNKDQNHAPESTGYWNGVLGGGTW